MGLRARLKEEFRRSDGRTARLGVAYFGERQHAGEMLRREARITPSCPDPFDVHGLAGDCGQRQRRAQHLPAALAIGAIYLDHRLDSPAISRSRQRGYNLRARNRAPI
jgi:hypothetical protein